MMHRPSEYRIAHARHCAQHWARELCEASDAYEGKERDAFIDNALKDYQQSFASAAAAE